jgi:hypothetical protein
MRLARIGDLLGHDMLEQVDRHRVHRVEWGQPDLVQHRHGLLHGGAGSQALIA